jgi:hypothetical protein
MAAYGTRRPTGSHGGLDICDGMVREFIVIIYRHHRCRRSATPRHMPRTIIDIPQEQLLQVDRISKSLGISRAEAVRRGLSEFVRQNEAVNQEGFGLWRGTQQTPAQLVDALRRHW